MTAATPQHTGPGPGPEVRKAPPGPPAPDPARRARSATTRRVLFRALPVSPAVVLLLLFLAGPIAYCVVIAFTDLQLTGQAEESFVGFENFRRAFQDEAFLNAVWLTLVFTVLSSLIGQNTLGLALASLMQRASKPVRTLTGGIVVTAWVLPEVVAGFLLYAFFRREGTLNAILDWLHLPSQNWLFTLPILAVSFANVWRGTAFSMLVYSAALNEIPKEVTEAAEVDGGKRLAPDVAHHAADDPALHRHQPDAEHPADPVGLRPDLGDDAGRPERQEPDAAAVHVLSRPSRTA